MNKSDHLKEKATWLISYLGGRVNDLYEEAVLKAEIILDAESWEYLDYKAVSKFNNMICDLKELIADDY